MRGFIILTACALGFGPWASARAEGVYFNRGKVLKEFFKTSERVSYEILKTRNVAPQLEELLGYLPKQNSYVIFVARTGDRIDGYAVIDNEQGQHLPITFATQISSAGKVQRVEVMVYREGQGDEIREQRFRNQFVDKGMNDPMRINKDLDAITGATISSKSAARACRRAVALVQIVRNSQKLARADKGDVVGTLR